MEPKQPDLPQYSRSQLALRNGQDREEVWVSYKGIIYDVSHSRLWREGRHYGQLAGQDLTDQFHRAPHTDRVFKKFKQIGILKDYVPVP